MIIQKNNPATAFEGKFSKQTLDMFAKSLSKDELKQAKAFRTGIHRNDNFSVIYRTEPVIDSYDKQQPKIETYLSVKRSKKNAPPIRLFLANGKLEYGEEMLTLIKQKMKFLDKLK